jgi:hypothetical protein
MSQRNFGKSNIVESDDVYGRITCDSDSDMSEYQESDEEFDSDEYSEPELPRYRTGQRCSGGASGVPKVPPSATSTLSHPNNDGYDLATSISKVQVTTKKVSSTTTSTSNNNNSNNNNSNTATTSGAGTSRGRAAVVDDVVGGRCERSRSPTARAGSTHATTSMGSRSQTARAGSTHATTSMGSRREQRRLREMENAAPAVPVPPSDHDDDDDDAPNNVPDAPVNAGIWRHVEGENDQYVPIWCPAYNQRSGPNFPPNFLAGNNKNPIDYFYLLFPEEAFTLMVTETNKYAMEFFDSPVDLPSNSRFNQWKTSP